jgi:hypothetical protein
MAVLSWGTLAERPGGSEGARLSAMGGHDVLMEQ